MLDVEVFTSSPALSNTYIVGDKIKCFVVDPSNDLRDIKKFIKKRQVLGIFLTHGHFDHFKGLSELLKEYHIKVYLHKDAYLKLLDPNISCSNMFGYNKIIKLNENEYHFINDGQKIILDDFVIKVLHTPGHTNCSVCLIIDELMFSGDTLFNCGIGRMDLPTGSSIQMNKSIKMLLNLKTNYLVYPGHGEETTIFWEMKNNPYYQRIK